MSKTHYMQKSPQQQYNFLQCQICKYIASPQDVADKLLRFMATVSKWINSVILIFRFDIQFICKFNTFMFRIRPLAHSHLPHSQRDFRATEHPAATQTSPFTEIADLLKHLISQSSSKGLNLEPSTTSKNIKEGFNAELEARDQEVMIPLPPTTEGRIQQQHLDQWITKVAQVVCSSAFRSYFKGEMTFEQTKIYCSENIMKNIIRLNQEHPITHDQFRLIDENLQKRALNYISKKYPLKQNVSISRKLDKLVQEIDSTQSIQNNQIANNKLDFQYRETGNYNDLIMKMINILILKVNPGETSEDHIKTNLYAQFEQYIGRIFQKVQDEDWMNKGPDLQLKEKSLKSFDAIEPKYESPRKEYRDEDKAILEKRERYRANVKEYSQAHFGRKIPQMVVPFSQKEIASGQLSIKHPSILRILTKWCEQLWQQFKIPKYYDNRSLNMFVQNICEIRSLYPWFREDLNNQLQIQKKNIEQYMRELRGQNTLMQVKLLEREKCLNKKGRYLDQLDQITGKFSINMSRNLHHQIVAELNRLIHGLMTVSRQFFRKNLDEDNFAIQWPHPPNLVSFKIGDIIRCKFSSKQKEIIAIYKQLQRISRQSPHVLNITRIKNRLKKSTNDILINVRFYQAVLCEIQLAINSNASDFIKCSNNFQHFLYELQRSSFGPMTELCSIRVSLDHRTEIYQQIMLSQKIDPQGHSCQIVNVKFKLKPNSSPFICYSCSTVHYFSSSAISHRKCDKCDYSLCSKCYIRTLTHYQLAKLIKNEEHYQQYDKFITKEEELTSKNSKYGFYVPLKARSISITYFRIIEHKSVQYIVGKNSNGNYHQISDFKNDSSRKQFLNSNIVVSLKSEQQLVEIEKQQARKKCIITSIVKQGYRKYKSTIGLQCLDLTTTECRQILGQGSESQKNAVVQIDLTDNQIQQLPFDPKEFPNLVIFNFSRNKIKFFTDLSPLSKLTTLELDKCGLSQMPSFLFEMTTLERLSFYKNPIKKIPQQISNLVNLKYLSFQKSEIQEISPQIGECRNLQTLSMEGNELVNIPDTICKLNALRCLNLFNNRIVKLPSDIGDLQNLAQLRIQHNYDLQSLPVSMKRLGKLKYIDFSLTKISDVSFLASMPLLQKVIIKNTKVENLSDCLAQLSSLIDVSLQGISSCGLADHILDKQNIKQLRISKCNSLQFPTRLAKSNIEKIQLMNNSFLIEKNVFSCLSSLKFLNLSFNSLTEFPILTECSNLSRISITNNNIITIPDIRHLSKLKQLDFSFNQIAVIDDILLTLSRIEEINASYNQIKDISVSNNEQQSTECCLSQLILGNNCLKDIPPSIIKCKKLKKLDLSFNPLTALSGIEELSYIQRILITDKQLASISTSSAKTYQLTNQLYEQVPQYVDQQCHLCKNTLKYPFYWLKWEEGQNPKFGCQKCVESPSTLPNHHYNYEKNSILLGSGRKRLLERLQMGNNIQPKIEQAVPMSDHCCSNCIKGNFQLGTARYLCLQCGQWQTDNIVDFCQKCWRKYNLEGDCYNVGENLPDNHRQDHTWLRVLYGDHYWQY